MKLSTKGRYGLKAMIDLAGNYGNGCLSASALARAQGISEPYLERIISVLKKAGYLRAVRGACGGYDLNVPPEKITVGEILRALEGTTTLIDCVDGEAYMPCSNACECSARPLWLRLQTRINDVLNETTLKDMADDYAKQKEHINKLKKGG